MTAIQIKPCPFCVGKPGLYKSQKGMINIYCRKCNARTRKVFAPDAEKAPGEPLTIILRNEQYTEDVRDIVRSWNGVKL